MTQLDAIWILTAALAVGAVLALAAAMISRKLGHAADRRRLLLRTRLLGEMNRPEATAASLSRIVHKAGSLGVLAPLVLQLRDVLRGRSYESFIERLTAVGAADLLTRQLRRGAAADRRRAAEALSAFRNAKTRAALRVAWTDPIRKVRFAALTASTEMGDPPTFEHALTLALKARCFPYAGRLLQRMAAQRPEEAADWLRRASLAPPLAITLLKGLAAAALLETDVLQLVASLGEGHVSPDVRAAALVVLAEHGAHHCKGAILNALRDKIWFVRVQAIAASGRLRIADASDTLVQLAEDPSWWVRLRASEALARLHGARA